jgi:hypothetical protein
MMHSSHLHTGSLICRNVKDQHGSLCLPAKMQDKSLKTPIWFSVLLQNNGVTGEFTDRTIVSQIPRSFYRHDHAGAGTPTCQDISLFTHRTSSELSRGRTPPLRSGTPLKHTYASPCFRPRHHRILVDRSLPRALHLPLTPLLQSWPWFHRRDRQVLQATRPGRESIWRAICACL